MFWIAFLLSSCAIDRGSNSISQKNTQENKDWLKIYERELQIAKDNEDFEAWSFFFREYLLEIKNRQKK